MDELFGRLALPVICAPMFLVSEPILTIAACKAGVVGSFNCRNARTPEEFESWIERIDCELAAARQADPQAPIAPYAVNLPVRRPTHTRFDADLEICVRHKVPLIISMNGNPREIVEAAHAYGGKVIHDVTSVEFARKAADAGVDGLIALCAGAGGHTGYLSPFALLPQIRRFFPGLVVLAGAITDGRSIRAAQVLGADLAYMGTRFIATQEAQVAPEYKALLLSQQTRDVMTTDRISGLAANFMRGSITARRLDPENLPPPTGVFQAALPDGIKAWRDVWSAGHGVGLIDDIPSVAELVARLRREYDEAAPSP
ncbi:MAG TPA: nitronate monooxygenase [Stellaceae bacterium]|nr:nitronate monooxygenase [Stellaceae bacterium]